VLFHLLAHADRVREAVLMVQREVAARLTATPGSRAYGLVTVLLRMRAEVEQRLLVQRGSFRPVPGVDSAVVTVRFSPRDRVAVRDRAGFERLIRTAFGQRRKMLRNTVLAAVPGLTKPDLEAVSTRAEIDLTRRPETLEVAEFARLSDALTELGTEAR
jgi:16S rRNA (adenine1518-N6/adenine1519-N6)-dimethyltransferase